MFAKPSSRSSISLRNRLQASSLLAVLAGYALLLVVNQRLAYRDRLERHELIIAEVGREVSIAKPDRTLASLQDDLDQMVTPGRMLWIEPKPGEPYQLPKGRSLAMTPGELADVVRASWPQESGREPLHSFVSKGRHFILGSVPMALSDGQAQLLVADDVTAEVRQARTIQSLVVAVAGISSLITSGLLRLVLRRGLRPLDQLSAQLEGIDAERLGSERLAVEGQPLELQPIVVSFNRMLDRLSAGRQREREFVDGVAHELRTPITLISGFTQRLQRRGNADATIEQIGREARRMTRLVSDLLDIARDEAGRLELRATVFDLDDVLLQAFERMEPLANGRLVLQPPVDGPPPLALGDPERLQQCLTNLVENAIKYTPADTTIELFSSLSGSVVTAHVRDHGPGVPHADKRRIFDRFVRGTVPTIGRDGGAGSGIGLSVVKLLVDHMGGSVEVADAAGGGADFQISLPSHRHELPSGSPQMDRQPDAVLLGSAE